MKAAPAAGRVLALAWALGILIAYVAAVGVWAGPDVLKRSLPFVGLTRAPDLPYFLLTAARLLALVAAVVLLGWAPGRRLGRFLRQDTANPARFVPLGWLPVSLLLLGLGLLGLWQTVVLLAVALPLLAAGLRAPRPRPDDAHRRWLREVWAGTPLLLPAGLMAWILLLICLAPETFQDPLRYHLFLPARFLLAHKIHFIERYFFWSYLGLPHMLHAVGLALAGQPAAKAVNLAMALASGLALLRIIRRAGLDVPAARLAVALAVTAPGLQLITGSVFIEHAWALYALLAVEAAMDPRPRPVATGLWLGLAFTAKFTALFGAAGVALMVLTLARRRAWLDALRRRAVPAAAALVLPNLPWALLRWQATGDPISPHLARSGLGTLDASSAIPLDVYYNFAGRAHATILAAPDELLRLPIVFAGAHGGYWEHPGPALSMLLGAVLLGLGTYREPVRNLLACTAGGALAWFAFCGGVSPHYIMAIAGLWTAALVATLESLAVGTRLFLTNLLWFTVFLQALLSLAAATYRYGPRDVALGVLSEQAYLDQSMAPEGVHVPIRRELARLAPDRNTVYVYGDDTSYYLPGRVFCDYENGCDPLIWRLCQESRTAGELRTRLKQRGFTHMLYSPRFPEILGEQHDLKFRFPPSVLARFERFWSAYARLLIVMEKDGNKDSYVYQFLFKPGRTDDKQLPTRRPYFIPGAEALVWDGDLALAQGHIDRARAAWTENLKLWPEAALLHDRLARLKAQTRAGLTR